MDSKTMGQNGYIGGDINQIYAGFFYDWMDSSYAVGNKRLLHERELKSYNQEVRNFEE